MANNLVEEEIPVPSSHSRETLDSPSPRAVFGIPIEQSTPKIPRVVKDCLDLLAEEGEPLYTRLRFRTYLKSFFL